MIKTKLVKNYIKIWRSVTVSKQTAYGDWCLFCSIQTLTVCGVVNCFQSYNPSVGCFNWFHRTCQLVGNSKNIIRLCIQIQQWHLNCYTQWIIGVGGLPLAFKNTYRTLSSNNSVKINKRRAYLFILFQI